MTFNLMWRFRNAAFVVADSAVTHRSADQAEVTSFGEFAAEATFSVSEAAIKVVRVSNGCVLALSGDASSVLEFASMSRVHLTTETGPAALLTAIRDYARSTNGSSFTVLMASRRSTGVVDLCACSFPDCKVQTDDVLLMAGNVDETLYVETCRMLQQLAGWVAEVEKAGARLSNDDVLTTLLGFLQARAAHDTWLTKHIGGTFTGLVIDDRGTTWARDTVYFLTGPTVDLKDLAGRDAPVPDWLFSPIFAAVRDSALYVRSQRSGTVKVLMNSEATPISLEAWSQRWLPSLSDVETWTNAAVYVFVNTVRQNLVVVARESRNTSDVDVQVADGQMHVRLHQRVVDALDIDPLNKGVRWAIIFLNSDAPRFLVEAGPGSAADLGSQNK